MTEPITAERLAAIKARLANPLLSARPWSTATAVVVTDPKDGRMIVGFEHPGVKGRPQVAIALCGETATTGFHYAVTAPKASDAPDNDADQVFVAHARADVEDLVAEVERLQARLKFLRPPIGDDYD